MNSRLTTAGELVFFGLHPLINVLRYYDLVSERSITDIHYGTIYLSLSAEIRDTVFN